MGGTIGLDLFPILVSDGTPLHELDRPAQMRGQLHGVLPDHHTLVPAVLHLDVDPLLKIGDVHEAKDREFLVDPARVNRELLILPLDHGLDVSHQPLPHGIRALLDGRGGVPYLGRGLARIAEHVGVEDERLLARSQVHKPGDFDR